MKTSKTLIEAPLQREFNKQNLRSCSDVESLTQAFAEHLFYLQGKHPSTASTYDLYMALAYCVRDRIFNKCLHTIDISISKDFKLTSYLSAEYLLGTLLENNLTNLGLKKNVREALSNLNINLDDIIEIEPEPGLGNGGLGRLASCFLDSLATLNIPSVGYGIRYEFGMFEQQIRKGYQIEKTDKWLSIGNPWEIPNPERFYHVNFGGYTKSTLDKNGNYQVLWTPSIVIKGVAYDTPIVGYNSSIGNILRLWKAEAVASFDFEAFNHGDYIRSIEEKIYSENITKILYPNDTLLQGKELRLKQQYFLVSCSLQDMIAIHLLRGKSIKAFHEGFCAQINDTHPALAIPELMRLLIDVYHLKWDLAWEITRKTFSYTNHTLLPEALETWGIPLFANLLPRILEIIYEINRRFLEEIKSSFPNDLEKVRRMSMIDETFPKKIRMANLACVGSHKINGVSRLHTEILKNKVLPDFSHLFPNKFINITNGVTPRRFLLLSNPDLAELITLKIGPGWITDLQKLRNLEEFVDDKNLQKCWAEIKQKNKKKLARVIQQRTGIVVLPDTLFDVQIKRIHEYKRQLLNVLHLINSYLQIKRFPEKKFTPRTVIFGGKAAPGYVMAKKIIKLITAVGSVINEDPETKDLLQVIFFPNYNVKNGQKIFPAADLSEQVSLAGKEASGTSNMKFALNGALTIGSYDGANIELEKQIGYDNYFLFGLKEIEVEEWKRRGYHPYNLYQSIPELKDAIDMIRAGYFTNGDVSIFKELVDSLLYQDTYMVLADYLAFATIHEKVCALYNDPIEWTRKSIINVARSGFFSSDRAISQYCQEVWAVKPITWKKTPPVST